MLSETAGYLAVSGLRMLTDSVENNTDSYLRETCPQLFDKTPDELGSEITLSGSHPFCVTARKEFQAFLDTLEDLREPGILGRYPTCTDMEVTFKDVVSINPDTTLEQFQAGRDAVEKCGLMAAKCTIAYRGLIRQASITRQFRVVSMIPGPFSRFSLFVKKTPYPDSYNAMGVKFDGNIDTEYSHAPASGKTFTGPLLLFNGTDSQRVESEIDARDSEADKSHLRSRGWIFIGPSGSEKDEAVFIKIPSGFEGAAGGNFMLGWPSPSENPVLAPEIITESRNFASDSDFPDHEFHIGGKYQGFYTWEEGNRYGAGARNLWPGLTAGDRFEPSDHLRSASTWLYLFGNKDNESRTLVIGPVLAGFLKFFFIEGQSSFTGGRYKGLWGSMTETAFKSNIDNSQPISGFTDLWGGTLEPPIYGSDLFLNGYESYKKIMPYNSLPNPSSIMPVNGIAFNMIFDFMKYQRDSYPDLEAAPTISGLAYDREEYLVPQAEEMRNSLIKGLHPQDEVALFFQENGQYDPYLYPDNCYFFGNLESVTVYDSNLVSGRITHQLDLTKCKNLEEEQEALEKFLFKKSFIDGKQVNVTDKSGIFLVSRRQGVSKDFSDALTLSSLPVHLEKPLIIVIDQGSLTISNDVISNFKDGSPEVLCSLALIDGHFFIDGTGYTREIHAYLASLNPASGRLLKPARNGGPTSFKIHGGLALTEIGLYESPLNDHLNHLGTTMGHFPAGGEIHYNPRFNPSLPTSAEDSRILLIETGTGRIEISGAAS